ncbi:MAG: DNA-processing protein DprA [Solirubrobacterales bacterium]
MVGDAPESWTIDPREDGYPRSLSDLRDLTPGSLYGVGDRAAVTGLECDAAVTIVGSRRPSPYGVRVAEELGRDLACAGATVVSGMANGIDAAAHRGALAGNGTTIAVLAGGPDVIYPPRQRSLYRQVVDSGAALSERPPGVVPEKWSFPARNRIMAALARVVVVVEAAQRSGSLITARIAMSIHREVGAVPGQIGVRVAEGTNGLLRDGAQLVAGAQDVLDRLAGVGARHLVRTGPTLDEDLVAVLDLVEGGATTPDAVALAAAIEPEAAAVGLARLELLGYVTADASGVYTRSALARPAPDSQGGFECARAAEP